MTTCACSMSPLYVYGRVPCCPSTQARSGRGVNLSDRLGISDSAVVTLRTASQVQIADSKPNLIQNITINNLGPSSRLRKTSNKQGGVSLGLKDLNRTLPRRENVSEVQYRVQDAVENGTEYGTDNSRRRNKDRNRKQRNSERRRRVQIIGNNGMIDLEEHFGLISDEEISSRRESGSDEDPGIVASADEEGRRILESSLLRNGVVEILGSQASTASVPADLEFSSELGMSLESGTSSQAVRSASILQDVREVELAEQESGASLVQDGDVKIWSERGVQGPRSLAALPGGRRVVELVAAWDGLAGRLPPGFSRSSSSHILLQALKLAVVALHQTSPDENGRTPLCRALAVAHTLCDLAMDAEVISTGLLREAVDSGLVSYAVIEQNLGGSIARLLHDCSRVRHIPSRVDMLDDDSAKALRQFCLAFHDIRAVVVELASQLDTMKHIHSLPRYRQQILALETMQIYAPLAHAIGTGHMALELEDLGFRVLFPDSYSFIENWLTSHWVDGSGVVDEFKEQLLIALEQDPELQKLVANISVLGRYKSRFSTMRKLLKDGRKPEEVYDVLGLRVILEPKADENLKNERENGVRACYRAMQVATTLWQEVPGRLKDYIANRKQNGYESLHLAVYVDQNEMRPPMEIQIRTLGMDTAAVSGEASHSLYKGGMTDPDQVRDLRLIMVAAANAAASRFGEIAGNAVDLEGGDRTYSDKDQTLFKMFDKNQDGVISVEEFREVIAELGANEEDALELMQIVDLNTDGSVSSEEFGKFRHQIQICQNLAGVDRVYSSQLGTKLQGSAQTDTESAELSSSKLLTNVATFINQKLEDNMELTKELGIQFVQNPGPSPLDPLHEKVSNQVDSSSGYDVGTSDRSKVGNTLEDVQRLLGTEASISTDAIPSKSKSAPRTGTPKSNLVKPVRAASPILQGNPLLLPKVDEEICQPSSSVRTATLEEVDISVRDGEFSAENVIEEQLSIFRRFLAGRNFVAAEDLIRELSEQYPENTKVLLHWGSLERKCGNLGAASALYSRAISLFEFKADLDVDYVRALQAWASLEVQAGNLRQARTLFAGAVQASEKGEPGSNLCGAGVYGLHGWALLEDKCGNWSRARDLLERAANLQPGNAVVHQSRATLEARAHNYAAARYHFKLAVEAAPEDVKCWHAWAMYEASRRNMKKMRELFKKALEVDPKNVHSLQAWAHHEGLLGTDESRAQARKLYQQCVDVNPNSVHCWQSWGILEESSGNFKGARVLFEKGLDINPRSVPCLQAYAHMERKCGNLETAQNLLRRAHAIDSNNAATLMELALIEDMLGNADAALDLYRQAAGIDKRKSKMKKRMFEMRKSELQESGALPKQKAAGGRWRSRSKTRKVPGEISSVASYRTDEVESQYQRIYAVATPR